MKRTIRAVVMAILLLQSLPAFADHDRDRREDRRWDREWGHGYVVRRLPPGYRSILWGGISYLYAEGLFYQYTPAGYVIVQPPVGAIVPALPPTYTTVTVQQTPYYFYNETYYTQAPNGYVIAAPPSPMPAPTPLASAAPAPEKAAAGTVKTEYKDSIDTYDIYIPNQNGSYTLVTLKKAEKGFIGPQGEFYPEHPTVEQLKALYGKK